MSSSIIYCIKRDLNFCIEKGIFVFSQDFQYVYATCMVRTLIKHKTLSSLVRRRFNSHVNEYAKPIINWDGRTWSCVIVFVYQFQSSIITRLDIKQQNRELLIVLLMFNSIHNTSNYTLIVYIFVGFICYLHAHFYKILDCSIRLLNIS